MFVETDSLVQSCSLQVPSELEAMTTILEWFDQFNRAPVPEHLWIEGQTGLMEGFTNVVRHAHKHLSSQIHVDLAIQISSAHFQIRIWDQGKTFNLEAALEDVSQKISEHTFNPLNHETSWGCIFLLKLRKDYGWTVTYTHESIDRNCLILEKKLTP